MASPTTIPVISQTQFAQRLAALFPNNWASPDAKQSGVAFALFMAIGAVLREVLTQVQYADNATLVPTETSPELDLASLDFYGGALPRPAGMSDANFANLILSGLFQPAATRAALSNAIQQVTGVAPRMIDPWNPGDTGAIGALNNMGQPVSYWGNDTPANPARWGGPQFRYQGFIETPPPQVGGNLGSIGYWGSVTYWTVPPYGFQVVEPAYIASIFSLVNRLRAYGITVWIRIIEPH